MAAAEDEERRQDRRTKGEKEHREWGEKREKERRWGGKRGKGKQRKGGEVDSTERRERVGSSLCFTFTFRFLLFLPPPNFLPLLFPPLLSEGFGESQCLYHKDVDDFLSFSLSLLFEDLSRCSEDYYALLLLSVTILSFSLSVFAWQQLGACQWAQGVTWGRGCTLFERRGIKCFTLGFEVRDERRERENTTWPDQKNWKEEKDRVSGFEKTWSDDLERSKNCNIFIEKDSSIPVTSISVALYESREERKKRLNWLL